MDVASRVFVAGAETPIGSAIVAALRRRGYTRVFGDDVSEAALTDPAAVDRSFRRVHPEYVFQAAGRSGGIALNQRDPADLMIHNLRVTLTVLDAARTHGVRKLLYIGSSCAYPKACPQPMRPDALMTGPLEWTSEYYATAKLTGIRLCQAYRRQYGAPFIAAIPANPFGPEDHFDDENSHVIAALIRRMHEAKASGAPTVAVWGSGAPRRDFLYADDLGDACVFVLRHYDGLDPINVGSGTDTSIAEVAQLVREVVGYAGRLEFDATRPDGMPLKLLDVAPLLALGWRPRVPLRDAIQFTYDAFLAVQPVLQ
ncbi:MAG: GDP-L-fucose synthase [Acidobacteria bacterium]|nr:GDP-L-fucose synthase [Acidobacteriota bacterium]